MKTFKGTKSEWKIVYHAMTTCVESGNKDICTLTSGLSEVNKSNAKLIASAPELLEALQDLAALIENGDLVRDISKDDDFKYFTTQGVRITKAISKYQKAINKAL